jgi:hypothetical protein
MDWSHNSCVSDALALSLGSADIVLANPSFVQSMISEHPVGATCRVNVLTFSHVSQLITVGNTVSLWSRPSRTCVSSYILCALHSPPTLSTEICQLFFPSNRFETKRLQRTTKTKIWSRLRSHNFYPNVLACPRPRPICQGRTLGGR